MVALALLDAVSRTAAAHDGREPRFGIMQLVCTIGGKIRLVAGTSFRSAPVGHGLPGLGCTIPRLLRVKQGSGALEGLLGGEGALRAGRCFA